MYKQVYIKLNKVSHKPDSKIVFGFRHKKVQYFYCYLVYSIALKKSTYISKFLKV